MDIRDIDRQTLSTANWVFAQLGYAFRVRLFTIEDMAWCIHLTRCQPDERQLPWDTSGAALTNPNAFNFSFLFTDTENKPAAACFTRFCPSYDLFPAMLNIEMVQNFHLRNSLLDGNTFSFVLLVATLFMAETHCSGLRLISPVNEQVAIYYIHEHGFTDISGSKLILQLGADALFRRLRQGLDKYCLWLKNEQ